FLPGVVKHHHGPLGHTHRPKGIPIAVRLPAFIPPSHPVPLQGPFSRAAPYPGGAGAPHCRSGGGDSKRSQRQGVLFLLFPNPKSKRGVMSYSGLTGTQQIYGKVEIPYALPGHYYSLYGSGRLVRHPRHEGRVFPHCHLPTSQTLPALRSGPETLPVHGPALRPLNGTEGLHEVYGSGSSRPSASKGSGVPLP
ncbi:hypothetical protein G0U57_021122, partial [Chelydra serpentina]